MAPGVFGALALLTVLGTSQGQFTGAESADTDPISFFAGLGELPSPQDAFLQMAGQSLMDNDPSITCNIFGGEDSCQTISADSEFSKTCQAYRPDLKVDCAYFSTSEEHLDTHPGDALNNFLQGAYNDWCVQALPECGSFQDHVHKAIFPAILAAKKEEDAGQPQSIAIAEAIPGLIAAMSKTLACKEMCEAAVSTCSCKTGTDGSDVLTFGDAILNAEGVEDGFQKLGLQTLGEDFRDTLFRDIWDKPVCDIFTSKDDPEFAGTCDEDVIGDNAQCTSTAFCDGLSDAQKAGTETIIAAQLARSVFAFVEGPSGVIAQGASSTEVAKSGALDELPGFKKPGTGVTPASSTPVPTPMWPSTFATDAQHTADVAAVEIEAPPEKKTESTFASVLGTLVLLVALGGIAVFGWKKYQEHRANQIGDYRPMDLEAYGDDGIPLQ